MRKIISTMLVLVMVLSVFTSFSAGAAHWAQEAIDYVTANGYWIASGDFEPDRPATRAETASLFARILISKIPENNGAYVDVPADNIYGGDITAASLMGLMVGYDGKFRPEDLVTREELACILDRAAKMVSDEFEDTDYNMALLKDRDLVSDWALQSVKNASEYVLMKGKGHKLFDPKGQTTRAEVATVVKALADIADVNNSKVTVPYTVRDLTSKDNIQVDFDVLQSARPQMSSGFGGFAMMARLSGGTQNIYLQRIHYDRQSMSAMAHPPSRVRIEDPNGNVVCRVDMDYKEGNMEKIVTLTNAPEGIYRVIFVSGSTLDTMSIGFQQPISWGFVPLDMFHFTSTQAQPDWYFYVPKKFAMLAYGIGGAGATAQIWTKDGRTRLQTTDVSTGTYYQKRKSITTLTPDTVYMMKLPEKFTGMFGMVGISALMCPTPEMAEDLKGGYIYYSDEYGDWQFEGPKQAEARKLAVQIYEENKDNLEVDLDSLGVPSEPPARGTLDNPRAEAMLYSAYFGSINGTKENLQKQCLDPTSPWFGGFRTMAENTGETDPPEFDWQHRFTHDRGGGMSRSLVGALTINAEINYWYANPVLQKRLELAWLGRAMQIGSTGHHTAANPTAEAGCSNYFRQHENFQFGEQGWIHGYYYSKNWLSPRVKALTDDLFHRDAEAVCMAQGQGVSNQMFMHVQGSQYSYMCFNDEFFHEWFARDIAAIKYPSSQPGYLGQVSPQGYWTESGGPDGGSYGRMAEAMWDDFTMNYLTMPEEKQRPEVVADLKEATERFLMWDSQWYAQRVGKFQARRSNAWTSREPAGMGGGSALPGNSYIQYFFPRAMANHDAQVAGVEDPDTFTDPYNDAAASTCAAVITSDEWAYQYIEKTVWPKYFKRVRDDRADSYVGGSSWSQYKALHLGGATFDYSEVPVLPYVMEGNYNIYDLPGGSIAAKHDGLYVLTYYNNDIGNRFAGKAWIHPGPTQMWDEYFSTISSSMEPLSRKGLSDGMNASGYRDASCNDYRQWQVEPEIVHMTILGFNDGGQLFMEGKGEAVCNWIEEGKSWAITHTDPFSLRNTTWKYFMHDEGWTFEAGFDDGVLDGEDLWVQIPLNDPSIDVPEAQFIYDAEARQVIMEHEGHTVTFSWDEGIESKIENKKGDSDPLRCLKLKLTPEHPFARFHVTRDMGDYVFVRGVRDGK